MQFCTEDAVKKKKSLQNTDEVQSGATNQPAAEPQQVDVVQVPYQRAFVSLFLGAVMIGFAPIFMRLSEVGTSAAAFWRAGLSWPLLLLIWLVMLKRGKTKPFTKQEVKNSALIGFFFAVDLYFWHWAVNETTVANATLMSNLAAVLTALFSYFIWRVPMRKSFFAGLGLAFAGAATLAGISAEINPDYLFGDFLGFLTAIAYAAYILTVAKSRQGMSTLKLMTGSTLATGLFLLPPALWEAAPVVPAEMAGWWPLLGLGLMSHAMGQALIAYGLMTVPAALGSLTLLIQPVIAAALAWVLFAEILSGWQMMGALMVLGGVYWAKRTVR